MARPSKEDLVLKEFFEKPLAKLRFKDLTAATKLAPSKLDKWLKRFAKEGIIKRVKERGRMPYYVAEQERPAYRLRKQFDGQRKLLESGLLEYCASLDVPLIILFGSFSRGDWHKASDVDIFFYGAPEDLSINLVPYEAKLRREVHVFDATSKDLRKCGSRLLSEILKGIIIRGDIPPEIFNAAAKDS